MRILRATIAVCAIASLHVAPVMADTASTTNGDASRIAMNLFTIAGTGSAPAGLAPRFVFLASKAVESPRDAEAVMGDFGNVPKLRSDVFARSADGKALWYAVELDFYDPCGMAPCPKLDPITDRAHGTMLFDVTGKPTPIAWSLGGIRAKHVEPQPIARKIDPGAEDAAKTFEASLAGGKLAPTISDRGDVVMYGSAKDERFVGGKAVRAQLVKWNLAFTVRDGVQAGVTASKTVAWVAANVDGARAGGNKTAYRVLAIYEKQGDAWRVVQLQFSEAVAR